MKRRGLWITLAVVAGLVVVLLLFTYEIIAIDWLAFMEDQPSVRYQEGPRLLSPADSVSFNQASYHDSPATMPNPVPADQVSLSRGAMLFGLHCSPCHGVSGQADGPITQFWTQDARPPANLQDARFRDYPDALLYRVITQGIGGMPPMRENLTERQVWDVVNHVKNIGE